MSTGGMLGLMSTSRSVYGLALLLAAAGASHFAAPRVYDTIVPRVLPAGQWRWRTDLDFDSRLSRDGELADSLISGSRD